MKQNPTDIQATDQESTDPIDFKYIIKQLVQIPVMVAALAH